MKKRLFGAIIIVLLISLIGLGYWFLMTASGFQYALNFAQKNMPALTIEQASGQLNEGISVTGLRYKPETGTQIQIGKIDGRWKLWSILSGRLLIDQLHISDVTLALNKSADADARIDHTVDFGFASPVIVHLRSLRVVNVDMIDSEGQKTLILNRFESSLRLNRDRLTFSSLSINREDIAFTLVGDTRLRAPYASTLNYGFKVNDADFGLISITGTISGNAHEMEINQQFGEPFASEQTLTLFEVLEAPRWRLLVESDSWLLSQLVSDQRGNVESITLTGEGDLQSAVFRLETDITNILEELPPLSLHARLSSQNLQNWLIDSQFQFANRTKANLSGTFDISEPTIPVIALTTRWEDLSWPMVDSEITVLQDGSGQLSLMGSPDAYKLLLTTQAVVMEEAISVTANGLGSQQQITINDFVIGHKAGNMHLDAEISWLDSLLYNLTMRWQTLKVPERFSPDTEITSQGGLVVLSGQGMLLELNVQTQMEVDKYPLDLSIVANSEIEGEAEVTLNILTKQGDARFEGQVEWLEYPGVTGQFHLNNFNPGQFSPEWQGLLNATATVDFEQRDEDGRYIRVDDLQMQGSLRDRQLALNATVEMRNDQLRLPLFKVSSGQSQLEVTGQLQPEISVDWQLDSPNLTDFHPELSGRVFAFGNTEGAIAAIQVNANIVAEAIAFEEIVAIEKVDAEIQFDLSDRTPSNIVLTLQNITASEQTIDSLKLTLNGQRQQHQLSLDMASEIADLSLGMAGSLDANMLWQGTISQMQLDNTHSGKWVLAQSGKLQLSATQQDMTQHCWQSDTAEVCLQGAHHAEQGWQTEGAISALPLRLFKPFYEEFANLEGAINARFTLMAEGQQSPTGNGEMTLVDGQIELTGETFKKQHPIDINELSLRYQLTEMESAFALVFAPAIQGVSPLDARLQTAPLYDFLVTPQQTPLALQLKTAIADLSLLALSHEAISDLAGQFNADIDIVGSLEKPEVTSLLTLRDAQVRIHELGILLEDLNADISGDPQSGIEFLFQGLSGEGRFEAVGEFLLPESGWQFSTSVKGENVQVMNLPEALVTASPDLVLSLDAESAKVTGSLVIPTAELVPLEFNRPVNPSQDVVIINQPIDESATMMQTDLDIHVRLGDDVRLSAAGFEGRLGGTLHVYGDAGMLLMANGEITLIEGAYAAYGRRLTVNDGRIRFSGGAIDNPDLDIRAVRTGSDWRAGIHITGPANNPLATLFSVPSMSQENILSYILLGRPIAQASAGDGAMLVSAATSLGIANGNSLGENIASTFGLDSLSFTGDSPETAAVEIGKYLSPKLYIGYGVGILDAVSTMQLRYQLSRIWTLQAESGTETGVDLLYIHER